MADSEFAKLVANQLGADENEYKKYKNVIKLLKRKMPSLVQNKIE